MRFTSPPLFVVLAVVGILHFVQGLFMDMYGKVFQIELLDDCSIYVYDRVLVPSGVDGWCKRPKSYMYVGIYDYSLDSDNPTQYVAIQTFYVDDDNILNYGIILMEQNDKSHYKLISQDYFETDAGTYSNVTSIKSLKHQNTTFGKYYINDAYDENYYDFTYQSCKYEQTSNVNISREVYYDVKTDTAKVTEVNTPCDPNLIMKFDTITVTVDPNHPNERVCKYGKMEFILHPIKQSILTGVLGYDSFPDFNASFPIPFSTPMNDQSKRNYAGISFQNKELVSSDGTILKPPPIETNYTEVPFFIISDQSSSYSPMFLYYKYNGPYRDFIVRFVYEKAYYHVFDPVPYMEKCHFEDNVTVAAAPKILRHNKKSISFEVYFLLNDANFKYCVFDVDFEYASKNFTINLRQTSDTNAYVHVKTRSKTAVNCDFGNRTVRWLLAYTEKKEAELVSLDNDVSSPIFPCPECGPQTIMYCDANPRAAETYDSAVYLVTGTEILYIGVERENYTKRIEYYHQTMTDKQYFVQQMSLTTSLDEIYKSLQNGTVLSNPEDPEPTEKGKGNINVCARVCGLPAIVFLIIGYIILTN